MSVFILETDAVSSAADGLSSIASKLEGISDTINGYDTSQSGGDNFDFEGAKAVIAANVKAASVKVKNTQTLMTSVVDSHTQLQASLKYGETGKEADKDKAGTQQRNTNDYSGPSGSSPGYSGSPSGSHSGSHSSYVPITPKTKDKDKKKDKDEEKKSSLVGIVPVSKDKYVTDDSKKKEIAKALSGVGLVAINKSLTDTEQKELNDMYDIKYTKEGLAKVGDRYVISCDESYGEVGDMVDLKQKDGSYVKCIIGGKTNTTIAENKNNIRFITKEDVSDEAVIKTTQTIKNNTTKVLNAGPETGSRKVTAPTPETNTNATQTPDTTATTQPSTETQPSTNTTPDTSSSNQTTTPSTDTSSTASEGITYTEQSGTNDSVTSQSTTTDASTQSQTTAPDVTTQPESTTTDTSSSNQTTTTEQTNTTGGNQ